MNDIVRIYVNEQDQIVKIIHAMSDPEGGKPEEMACRDILLSQGDIVELYRVKDQS